MKGTTFWCFKDDSFWTNKISWSNNSPTARYAGEGNAGIVNIITKQDKLEGFTAGVNTIGTRVNRTGANLVMVIKKLVLVVELV